MFIQSMNGFKFYQNRQSMLFCRWNIDQDELIINKNLLLNWLDK